MINWPRIPSYSDSENSVFHPVFKFALEFVLRERNIKDIEVIQQFPTASGPVDLVLRRKSTRKIIFPIEIKRTQSDVRGIGRRQGRDYQHNIASFSETSFYCVSNLELTEFFVADIHRQTTISQQIKLDTNQNALLDNEQDEQIKNNLLMVINEIFDIVFAEKRFSFVTGLTNLECSLRNINVGSEYWHKIILPFCYEYIRGTVRLESKTSCWRPASSFMARPQKLIELGGKIDFKHIFAPPLSQPDQFQTEILEDAYNSGKAFGDGDDFSALIDEILFDPQRGVVETDFDLARLLAIAAKHETQDWNNDDDIILDPCAGSGRLLAAMIKEVFPSIEPANIMAVEQEKRFSEVLSLRLGLQLGNNLSPEHSPNIKICPFEEIEPKQLTNVKIALVNPPFMSGVYSAKIKNRILERINSLTGKPSIVGNGQIGYEAIFMELLWHMLPEGCTISFIFPYQVISRISREITKLRRFLIDQLSISTIILYPRDRIFKKVVKKTAIFVGRKGITSKNIRIIDIQIPVPDVNFMSFKAHLDDSNISCYGVKDSIIPREKMVESVNNGWHQRIGVGAKVVELLNSIIKDGKNIVDYSDDIRRGTMGNSGNTALTVMSPEKVFPHVPETWISGAINNAKKLPVIITRDNAPNLSFIPPEEVQNINSQQYKELINIVNKYIEEADGVFSTKKQKTNQKSLDIIIKDILRDQKNPVNKAILIPRACRRDAKLSIIDKDKILVSTNFIIISVKDDKKRGLIGSWLKSIFGQLQLELFSTSQEGMRKLEESTIKCVSIPNLESIDKDKQQQLVKLFSTEPFLDLSNINPRSSDKIWAEILDNNSSKELLERVVSMLQEEYDNREQ